MAPYLLVAASALVWWLAKCLEERRDSELKPFLRHTEGLGLDLTAARFVADVVRADAWLGLL